MDKPGTDNKSVETLAYHIWWRRNKGKDTDQATAVQNYELAAGIVPRFLAEGWGVMFEAADIELQRRGWKG